MLYSILNRLIHRLNAFIIYKYKSLFKQNKNIYKNQRTLKTKNRSTKYTKQNKTKKNPDTSTKTKYKNH